MAGFFGLFDYSKAGPGISKNGPQKKRIFVFFDILGRKFWKLIQLNFLYLLFCIPAAASAVVVLFISSENSVLINILFSILLTLIAAATIGPATAGLTYVLRNYSNEKHSFIFSDFWDAFKSNYKQSFIFSLISITAAIMLNFAIRYYYFNLNTNKLFYIPFIISASLAIIYVFMNFYAYLLIITLELKMPAIIKNSFIFSVLGVKSNFFTVLFTILILLVNYFVPISLALVFINEIAIIGLIICFNSFQYIQKYAIDPYLNTQNTQDDIVEEDVVVFEDTVKDKKKIN